LYKVVAYKEEQMNTNTIVFVVVGILIGIGLGILIKSILSRKKIENGIVDLTKEQLEQIKILTQNQAKNFKLDNTEAQALADSLIRSLAGDNTTDAPPPPPKKK
jgi:hypothetical protein